MGAGNERLTPCGAVLATDIGEVAMPKVILIVRLRTAIRLAVIGGYLPAVEIGGKGVGLIWNKTS